MARIRGQGRASKGGVSNCKGLRRTPPCKKKVTFPAESPVVFECSCNETVDGSCPYDNRCREPLAWTLDPASIVEQVDCPLFTTLPNEIRLLIWEFALIDSTNVSRVAPIPLAFFRKDCVRVSQHSDIAFALLRTCRAVYLETYTLPVSCNIYYMPQVFRHCRIVKYLAFQYASIQRLEINIIQAQLEGHNLADLLFKRQGWNLKVRNNGSLVAPRYISRGHFSRNFILVPTTQSKNQQQRLWDAVQHDRALQKFEQFPPSVKSSPLRITLARPITQLTLRLDAESWWTWTDDPLTCDGNSQLALDPTLGDGSDDPDLRPTQSTMRKLAHLRRVGRFDKASVSASSTWGTVVGSIPGIKSLELVLETFVDKKHQLDAVVECAKTWKYPIADSQQVLLWDGRVEEKSWTKVLSETSQIQPTWNQTCSQFEVRIVRFVRKYDR